MFLVRVASLIMLDGADWHADGLLVVDHLVELGNFENFSSLRVSLLFLRQSEEVAVWNEGS